MKRGFYSCFLKRFLDFIISLLAVIILSPIFLITYLLSLIILRGNPIFKQYRPGKNGKIFPLYKFRSMTNKTDENGELLPDAQRITGWGKFLRKTSIDELPQLFNILRGDMSIVGPRPRLVKDMIFYDDYVMKAYSVRPGLTGPAQVYDRKSESSWESVFERDLEYAEKLSFATDVKLFFGTFISVFKGGSASGSATESKTEKREYYYADYLLKANKITKEQYDEGHRLASEIEKQGKGVAHKTIEGLNSSNADENNADENKVETKPETEEEQDVNSEEKSETQAEPEVKPENDDVNEETKTKKNTKKETKKSKNKVTKTKKK